MSHVEQEQNLKRVSARIETAVMAFCRAALKNNSGTFRMDDLGTYVRLSAGVVAPDSASRILRQLRAHGHLDYTVESRAQSLYRITKVQP